MRRVYRWTLPLEEAVLGRFSVGTRIFEAAEVAVVLVTAVVRAVSAAAWACAATGQANRAREPRARSIAGRMAGTSGRNREDPCWHAEGAVCTENPSSGNASDRLGSRGTAGVAEQEISGFHQDEAGDWVADLACGHTQHVRHRPPWELRLWVTTEEGRRAHLGVVLQCKKCDEESG